MPSTDNIAALRSRSDFELLHRFNAFAVSPVFDDSFLEPSAWKSVGCAPFSVLQSICIAQVS